MKRITRVFLIGLAVLLTVGLTHPAAAQWPSDPAVNLAIANYGTGEQSVPKIAGTPDGGCYVGWYDNSHTGNYDIYLQRLDAYGREMWPHNGICVSSHAQNSWVTDWDLISDSQGNCIVAFNDMRKGNWDVFVYKISSAGLERWGADGQAVSGSDPDDEVIPTLAEASDGDIVAVWCHMDGSGVVKMQRLAPDGTWRFPAGAISVVTAPGTESPAFPDVIPSLNGDVIVSYVRDISSYMSPRYFLAQRFNSAGAPVWASTVAIMDNSSLPMGYSPTIQPDGSGGLVTAWHRVEGNHIYSLAQHVDAQGVESFTHNGVRASSEATQHLVDPAYSYDAASNLLYVFWNQRNPDQSAWGIYGQKLTSAGARAWGDLGRMVLPVDAVYKSYPRTLQLGSDVILFVTDEPSGGNLDRIRAWRMTPSGVNAWAAPATVSSYLSGKGRFPVAINGSGMSVILWEDDRNGSADIYGQNVNADGTIGAVDPALVDDGARTASPSLMTCIPNPSSSATALQWTLSAPVSGATVAITDVTGRLVRRVDLGALQAGSHSISWDGRDEAGNSTAGGIYLVRLAGMGDRGAIVRLVRIR